jgi:hypothetical protein
MSDNNHQDFGSWCEINMPRPPRPHQQPTTKWVRPVQVKEKGDLLTVMAFNLFFSALILGCVYILSTP